MRNLGGWRKWRWQKFLKFFGGGEGEGGSDRFKAKVIVVISVLRAVPVFRVTWFQKTAEIERPERKIPSNLLRQGPLEKSTTLS